jgi:hypothetical protein
MLRKALFYLAIFVVLTYTPTVFGGETDKSSDAQSAAEGAAAPGTEMTEEQAVLEFPPAVSSPSQKIEVDVDGDTRTVTYDLSADDLAMVQGDIILGPGAEIEAMQVSETPSSLDNLHGYGLFRKGTGYVWPKGVLRFVFDPSFASKDMVRAAMNEWQQKTPVRFEELSSPSGDYVRFVSANECSSHPGRYGGQQLIRLSGGCGVGGAIHEIGHALGLGHEQMRSDRDQFLMIVTENVEPAQMHNFNIDTWRYNDVGPYCYESIMQYPKWAFGKIISGKRLITIIPKKDGVEIGQRKGLAQCDVDTIKAKYQNEFARN